MGLATISSIRSARGRSGMATVVLDDGGTFDLAVDVLVERRLKVGQTLSDSLLRELLDADVAQRCYNAAVRLLAYRHRSEAEVRLRLRQRQFDVPAIEGVVSKLKQQGLLDDDAFARFWKDSRQAVRPRSRRMIKQELRHKGVGLVVAEGVSAEVNDDESALAAARRRAGRLASAGSGEFRRLLGEYLRRRGFSYETAKKTVDRVWDEMGGDAVVADDR